MSGPAPSIQYAWDGPGTLGAGQDGYALVWSQSQGKFIAATAGVTDHGALSGLADDDHPQYALADGSRGSFAATSHSHSAPAHSALSGLSADDHSQYALLAGRSGGQTLVGDTASGGALTLVSTSHGTKGVIDVSGASAIQGPNGSASVPTWSFSGDTDTGIYRSAANYLSVTTAGAERLRITDSAIVVINPTTTPFTPEATTKQGIVVKGLASQTANLQEWQNSAGTVLTYIDSTGRLRVGSSTGTFISTQSITGSSSGAFLDSGSTANGWQFRDTGSAVKLQFNNAGIGFFGATPVAKAAALTAANASALNTGDATSDTVIGNIRTRLGELESRLQAYGLLT